MFHKIYPGCIELKEVIIKCCILNDFYCTNILKVVPVAKHIIEIEKIDKKLAEGKPTIVDEIVNAKLGKMTRINIFILLQANFVVTIMKKYI